MTIKTPRLVLRNWLPADAPQLFFLARDPDIGEIAGWKPHESLEYSENLLTQVVADPLSFAVVKDGELVGCVELMTGNKANIPLGENEAEIGFWIGKPFWGNGYVTEAVNGIIRHAFETLNISRLWCCYFDGNEKSRRVGEKCGFTYRHTEKDTYWREMNYTKTIHVCVLEKQ
jgi:Acetyltransferases, including N-acetylases of ribosomal proteins